jgi:hypothetical protein
MSKQRNKHAGLHRWHRKKSEKPCLTSSNVIPAQVGIQYFQVVAENPAPVLQRGDDFLLVHLH